MTGLNVLIPKPKLEEMSRRDRKKQETRWGIYTAAMKLMAEKGFDAVTIEEICEAADVSNPLFFHHFSNKAALVGAYMERLRTEIAQKLASAQDATSREKLRIISREVARASNQITAFTPQLLQAMGRGEGKLDLEHVETGLTGALANIIEEGQESGEFSATWHPEVVAVSLVGAWLVLPQAAQNKLFPAKPHEELLDLILTGLQSD